MFVWMARLIHLGEGDGSPLCVAAIDEAGDSCEDTLVTDKDGRVVLIRRSELQ